MRKPTKRAKRRVWRATDEPYNTNEPRPTRIVVKPSGMESAVKPLNKKGKCPKCGGGNCYWSYRVSKCETTDSGYIAGICKRSCPECEHFCRGCRDCGFTWAEAAPKLKDSK